MPAEAKSVPRLDVRPEPDPSERAALEQALARVGASEPHTGRSRWWREGVRENVSDRGER